MREESVFVDWQRIKVQEGPDEVPAGSLPRTMDVIVRNKQVGRALSISAGLDMPALTTVAFSSACCTVTVHSTIFNNSCLDTTITV